MADQQAIKVRGKTWTDNDVKTLIALWRDHFMDLQTARRNRLVYERIADELRSFNIERTWMEVRFKIKNLTFIYRVLIDILVPKYFTFENFLTSVKICWGIKLRDAPESTRLINCASVIYMFMPVYFKQRGLTVSQQSLIYMASPPVQFLGPTISGLIADKIGRSKVVLQANIVLTLIFTNAMLLIPEMVQPTSCARPVIEINCNLSTVGANLNESFSAINASMSTFDAINCSGYCPIHQSQTAHSTSNGISDFNVTANISESYIKRLISDIGQNESDIYNKRYMHAVKEKMNASWCENNVQCVLKCFLRDSEDCAANNKDNTTYVFILCFILMISFQCTLSNCYRFMDVTTMAMVKAHDSDFGRERVWAVISILVMSPISGYLIKMTTQDGAPQNYASVFYFFDITTVITGTTVILLDVQINPPGQKMWRKTVNLLKNPDILVFAIAVLVLGTSWCFHRFYSLLYLDQLNASSFLLGLLPAMSSLVTLPFLFTSNWWVKKIGSTNLILIAFISYVITCVGYSFLVEPWYALIYEMLGIFTYHLLWVAVVRHSHELAPEGLKASLVSTAGGLHYGLGKGTGSSIGLIMGAYGGRVAYWCVAGMCAAAAIFFYIYTFLRSYCRRKVASSRGEIVALK